MAGPEKGSKNQGGKARKGGSVENGPILWTPVDPGRAEPKRGKNGPGGKKSSEGADIGPAMAQAEPSRTGEKRRRSVFDIFSSKVAAWSGKPATFVAAVVLILVWGVSGPIFGFSETWQLVVNTGTTIITFLMVFVLQNSQNRDGEAVQTKLDELILSSHAANDFVGIEKLDEQQLRKLSESLRRHAERLGRKAEEISPR